LNVSLSGSAGGAGACTTRSSDFPPQPVAPLGSLRGGGAFFDTTATADGAVGTCATTWDVVFTNPDYPTGNWPVVMNQIRCDNAAGANGFRAARVGCRRALVRRRRRLQRQPLPDAGLARLAGAGLRAARHEL